MFVLASCGYENVAGKRDLRLVMRNVSFASVETIRTQDRGKLHVIPVYKGLSIQQVRVRACLSDSLVAVDADRFWELLGYFEQERQQQ